MSGLFDVETAGLLLRNSDVDFLTILQLFLGIVMVLEDLAHEVLVTFLETPGRLGLILDQLKGRRGENAANVTDHRLLVVESLGKNDDLFLLGQGPKYNKSTEAPDEKRGS